MKVAKWIMTVISVLVLSVLVSVIVMSAVLGVQARQAINKDESKTRSSYTELTSDIQDEIRDVYIEAARDMEVRLGAAGDESCHVVYYNSDSVTHTVQVEDGVLKITCVDERAFGSDLGFGDDPYITVSLPEKQYGEIKIVSDSGTIQSNAALTCDRLELIQNKGDIYLTNASCGEVNLSTVSGDVTIATLSADIVEAQGTSSEFSVMNVDADDIKLSAGSGRLEAYNIEASESAAFVTDKGDIFVQGCSGRKLTFDTDKGDVDVSLMSEMEIDANSVSGEVTLPEQAEAAEGRCTVRTNSGDIEVTYDSKQPGA